ncbi:WD repeat-containing protein 3 [Diachasma alloeum]|uniref:WD repeat-containing protein 3 n=1 Tax=Diachasma alloeum TaxID=454923 RepID=UPI000738247E|nr:WD repeat-containing protein 3 [Diachasma alloeum]
MPLTKQYLRYIASGNLNIITSPKCCNLAFVTLEAQQGRFVAVGACEHVFIWDLRLSEKAQVLTGESSEVTCLAASPNKRHLAVGYADGTIKTYDLRSGENISIFVGHKCEITSLSYDSLGHRLASGSKDTDVIVWDVVAESGICRLVGHKGVITKVSFMLEHNVLITSSKDTFIKFWDLDTEHNFRTIVGHRSEVWGFTLVKDDKYLVTGCNDHELRVYKIYHLMSDDDESNDLNACDYPLRCDKVGSILRKGKGRVVSLSSDPTSRIIVCHGVENSIELFHLIPDQEVEAKVSKRRLKKAKNRAKRGGGGGEGKEKDEEEEALNLSDEVRRLPVIKVTSKAKSVDVVMGNGGEVRVCVGLNNNSIELYSLNVTRHKEEQEEVCLLRSITSQGHRTDVRAISFSSDNLAFATVSGDSIKLWNRPSLVCLTTVQCGYALSVTFVPGDRHVVVGMKDGNMLIVDIASGDILEEIQAHTGEVWSIVLYPDLKGVASGGGDQTVKFWNFELIEDDKSDTKCKVLSVLHKRTLKLEEGVLCVRISPNGRFVAVALLDSTVKIFFLDTFKFFISLYGHKLPVLCMDISSDSTLIATGSADRNIKIWGMDFGDCHKSLFAHDDSVTGLNFVPRTHYFFTSGKDGRVKEWDADSFQKIVTLQGHTGEAWNCAVSPNGMFVASCGSDKVVRLYERSSEPLVLEDEGEEEREKQENQLATGNTTAVQGQKQQILPSRKTVNSEKAAELILECLDISKAYNEELERVVPPNAPPAPPLLMQAYNCTTSEEYLLETLKRIRAGDMEETLLLLPFSAACQILSTLPTLLRSEYQAEMLSRLAVNLIQAHHGPIVANSDLLPVLEEVRDLAMKRIGHLRDTVGYNLYGMTSIQREVEDKDGVQLFHDATKSKKNKNKIRKSKERALKRAIMAL